MWAVLFSNESVRTLGSFNVAAKKQIMAGIRRASENPLPAPEGCGQPLAERTEAGSAAFFKIDLPDAAASIVYSLTSEPPTMNILFIVKT